MSGAYFLGGEGSKRGNDRKRGQESGVEGGGGPLCNVITYHSHGGGRRIPREKGGWSWSLFLSLFNKCILEHGLIWSVHYRFISDSCCFELANQKGVFKFARR